MAYNHEWPDVDPYLYNSDWMLNKLHDHENRITKNEADIAQNKEDIAANATAIAKNAADIAANTAAIAKNAGDIAANSESIRENSRNIAQNANAIMSQSSKILMMQQDINSAHAQIDDLETDMATAQADILELQNRPIGGSSYFLSGKTVYGMYSGSQIKFPTQLRDKLRTILGDSNFDFTYYQAGLNGTAVSDIDTHCKAGEWVIYVCFDTPSSDSAWRTEMYYLEQLRSKYNTNLIFCGPGALFTQGANGAIPLYATSIYQYKVLSPLCTYIATSEFYNADQLAFQIANAISVPLDNVCLWSEYAAQSQFPEMRGYNIIRSIETSVIRILGSTDPIDLGQPCQMTVPYDMCFMLHDNHYYGFDRNVGGNFIAMGMFTDNWSSSNAWPNVTQATTTWQLYSRPQADSSTISTVSVRGANTFRNSITLPSTSSREAPLPEPVLIRHSFSPIL